MSSLQHLKHRISAIGSTKKITKAMQMVAASKLKKSKEAAEQSKEYAELMGSIVRDVVATLHKEGEERSLLFGAKIVKRIMVVVISSDRGLCGSYNASIMKFAHKIIKNHIHNGKEIVIFTVGKRSYDYFRKRYPNQIIHSEDHITGKLVEFEKSCDLASTIIKDFDTGVFDKCEVVYSHFYSVINQKPTAKILIPANCGTSMDNESGSFTFDPSRDEILETLVPNNIRVQFHHTLIEANASEHASRMTAMDSATSNCGEMISSLKVQYNRTRQAQITKELVEIISGAEAI